MSSTPPLEVCLQVHQSPVRLTRWLGVPASSLTLLSVEYAVGRLDLDVDGYSQYVISLLDYEHGRTVPRWRWAAFLGTRHPSDPATHLSANMLEELVTSNPSATGLRGYATTTLVGDSATKANLGELLLGTSPRTSPAFIFTATHGMGWPPGDPHQAAMQGALLCQDWRGFGKISGNDYLAAEDVPAEARLEGMVTLHFASFGAGAPHDDNFLCSRRHPAPRIADIPFVAQLPKTLLSHSNGAALAVIGQAERAWWYSPVDAEHVLEYSTTPIGEPQLIPFRNAIGRILNGAPVGHAIKDFRDRFAALSSRLASMLEMDSIGAIVPDEELVSTWIERNEAQSYVVLGDPAARLRMELLQSE